MGNGSMEILFHYPVVLFPRNRVAHLTMSIKGGSGLLSRSSKSFMWFHASINSLLQKRIQTVVHDPDYLPAMSLQLSNA